MTTVAPEPPGHPWFDPAVLVATCCGLGGIRFAPGTWGAFCGLVAAEALARADLSIPLEAGLLVAANAVGVLCCSRAARLIGRGKDPGMVVYDEAASLPLVLLAIPPETRSPAVLLAAFACHRLFDIAKPFPCRRLERLPAGLGIMADDWAAAGYACACVTLARAAGWL